MKSNFSPLRSVSPELFKVVHSAEKLFSNNLYDYIPTALRVYTEGMMQDIMGIFPDDHVDLNEMIRKFENKFYPSSSLSTSSAHELRIKGNKSSHFKPEVLSSGELIKLFKQAFQLQYFYLKKFKDLKVTTGSFQNSNFPSVIGGDIELQDLQLKLNESASLVKSIEEFKKENFLLEEKIVVYQQENEKITAASTDNSKEKKRLEAKVSSLERKLSKEKNVTNSNKVTSAEKISENKRLESKIEELSQQITLISQKQQQYKMESNIYAKKVTENQKEQEKQYPKRDILIKKAIQEIAFEKNSNIIPNQSVELDEKQEELININAGLHFLAAPPGSGKTMILTKRLKKAIQTYPDDTDIICLTFTTRAAQEMRDRAEQDLALSSMKKRTPFIGNFHNFCLDLHRKDKSLSFKERFATILDDDFRKEFFEKAFNKVKAQTLDKVEPLIKSPYSQLVDELNQEKANTSSTKKAVKFDHYLFLSPKLYPYLSLLHLLQQTNSLNDSIVKFSQEQVKDKLHQAIIACQSCFSFKKSINYMLAARILWKVLFEFKQYKAQVNAIDYDDILCSGLISLAKNKKPKKFIQIDEVQDLNPLQWFIIDQLKSEKTHIFAVGDNDQSIYSFLGANAQAIEHETRLFVKHSLINNYRSNPEIVKLLNCYRNICWKMSAMIAKNNKTSVKSTMLFRFSSIEEEYSGTISAVKSILNKPERNIGILLPTNKRVDALCEFFDCENLPYFRVSSSDLMQSPIIQDWFCLLKMHKGTANRVDWYKIVYRLAQIASSPKQVKISTAMDFVNKLYEQNISISDIAEIKNNDQYHHRLKTLVDAWEHEEVVIFDTETTGLDFDKSKIAQLAAIKVKNGKIIEVFDKYIKIDLSEPNLSKDFDASAKIHKITREQINNGDKASDVFSSFFDFIGDKPLIAHNMNFDNTMLRMGVFSLNDINLENRFSEATQISQFDTLLLARSLLPNEGSYKLADLLKSHNLEGTNSHNALDDVKATASLLELLIKKIKKRIPLIDEIIDEHLVISYQVQQKITEINRFFRRFYASGEKIKLSTILEEWVEYAYQQQGWYNNKLQESILKEIKSKLCSWLASENYEDHIQNLLDDMNPSYQKLATLKESDLIQSKDRLIISTIHRSKGLEFETVIIPEATSGQYPGWRPKETLEDELKQHKAEQKRLLYVALSRPINKLIVSYHLINAHGYPTSLSDDLNDCIPAFSWKNF